MAGRPRYPELSAAFQRRLVEWSDSGGAGRGGESGTGVWAPDGPRVTVLPRPSECAPGGGARAEAGAGAWDNTRARGGASKSEEGERLRSWVQARVILERVGSEAIRVVVLQERR